MYDPAIPETTLDDTTGRFQCSVRYTYDESDDSGDSERDYWLDTELDYGGSLCDS
jgi:hypothetical protein